MKNFVKNYLLLVLMGLGFVFIFGSMIFFGEAVQAPAIPEGSAPQEQAQSAETTAPAVEAAQELTPLSIEKMDGEIKQFQVELALSEPEWQKGLMGRPNLPEDRGMLFVFPDEQERSFWMKNVLIPLDVVFIDAEGLVHHIIPNTTPGDTSSHRSNGPVPFVLELAGGVTEKLGIDVGDKVLHDMIKPIN